MSQKVSYGRTFFDFLSSVKLAVLLLSLIALSSVLGTLIKQDGSPEEYIELYSEKGYRIISFLGLDDVFHAKWFILLLLLFALNLFVCSLKRLRRDLKRNQASAFKEDGTFLYGVHLVHGSIILILIGSLIGLLFGFRGYVSLKKGEEKDYITLRGKKPLNAQMGFVIKCKDFRIDFYPDGTPKDYTTEIEILKNGSSILEKRIRVNEPINYEGLYFYQASYGKEPTFFFEVDGKERILKENDVLREDNLVMKVIRYETSIHHFGPGVMVAYLKDGNPETTWFLKDIERMSSKKISGKTVKLKNVEEELYTVLEVTKDPGIYVVWSGFFLLVLGLFLTFFITPKRSREEKMRSKAND